eukprot:3622422-Amphidinium_carterae.1
MFGRSGRNFAVRLRRCTTLLALKGRCAHARVRDWCADTAQELGFEIKTATQQKAEAAAGLDKCSSDQEANMAQRKNMQGNEEAARFAELVSLDLNHIVTETFTPQSLCPNTLQTVGFVASCA